MAKKTDNESANTDTSSSTSILGRGQERGLGRGLASLIGANKEQLPHATASGSGVRTVPVAWLYPSTLQPRRHMTDDALAALAQSIQEHGVVQPIVVRPHPSIEERYEIIAGERRWRAAQKIQRHEVPVVIREMDDEEAFEVAVVENVQRADLDAVEEALAYRKMVDEFKHSQEQVAKIIGKSRAHIANMIRLLTLPAEVQEMLIEGVLTAGHARALVGVSDAVNLARQIVSQGLSVRAVERLVAKRRADKTKDKNKPAATTHTAKGSEADIQQLERSLSLALGLSVSLTHNSETGSGAVRIIWRTTEQFDALHSRLMSPPST